MQNDFRRVWSVLREMYDPASGEGWISVRDARTLARVAEIFPLSSPFAMAGRAAGT